MPHAFELQTDYAPAGHQPAAIEALCEGLGDGLAGQTLLGVTGSGKTFTIANIVQRVQRPAIVLAPNKTLAAQLYGEFREFFPNNAVEYFVSYYDYYQPEAYVPASDLVHREGLLRSTSTSSRCGSPPPRRCSSAATSIIVASVSSIYGLGDPQQYHKMVLHLKRGARIDQRELLQEASPSSSTPGTTWS